MLSTNNKPIFGTDKKYRGVVANQPWSLCVGAGISVGLVPTWQELTRKVVNDSFGTSYSQIEFANLVTGTKLSLDALLQGAANHLLLQGKNPEAFSNLLEKHIYDEFLQKADSNKLKNAAIESLNNPRLLKKDEIIGLHKFFLNHYGSSTLVVISELLATAKENDKGPQSIINFNADTLLYSVLDLFLIKKHFDITGIFEHPSKAYKKTLRGVDSANANVTPIFHCHGAISPESIKSKAVINKDARENLVFSEGDYLKIAGNISTWAQSLFLFQAQCTRLLIVGHSMSDSNIRKWLAWSHENSMREIKQLSGPADLTPRHIWITVEPRDSNQKLIQETSLLHIGVRICWISGWDKVGETLRNLLAL